MMYDSSQVYNQTMHIAMKVLETGAKLGGEIAKTVLLTALEKVKETKENKTGLTILKNLLKSKEELGVIKINKDNLSEFKSKAKKLGVTFASISSENSNEVKIMYKTRQTNQVKECLMEMLEHEQANKLDEIQENSTMVNQSKNNEEKFVCSVCEKDLSIQKIVCLKACGHVICQHCLDIVCSKEEKCSLCGVKYSPSEIIRLQESGTGFSTHNKVVTNSFTPFFKY